MTAPHGDVRVRFAPSPTGSLHAGGLRTALINFLFRRSQGGALIFRLEDTDAVREVQGAENGLLDDLAWAGITFDEGLREGGKCAPYRQSDRRARHLDAAQQLIDTGTAYRCWCTPSELEAMRRNAAANGFPPRYDRRCRRLSSELIAARLRNNLPFVVRLKMPETGAIEIIDLFRGMVAFPARHLDDPILVRSDQTPTGLFAAAVDDFDMRITHILRGEEWLASTPYQALIHRALGGADPVWGHLAMLLNEQRAKLSKRHPGADIAELRRDGYLPEAVCRYLAGIGRSNFPADLGWTMDDLAASFDLTAYRAGDAVFSLESLKALNMRCLQELKPPFIARSLRPFITDTVPATADWSDERFAAAAELVRNGPATLKEAAELLSAIITHHPTQNLGTPGERAYDELKVLGAVFSSLSKLSNDDWRTDDIAAALKSAGAETGLSGRRFYHPIRIALTGLDRGPELPRIAQFLGRTETLRRLKPITT